MNRLERNSLCAGILVLLFTLEFMAGLLGWGAAVGGSALLGAVLTFVWTQFDLPAPRLWTVPLAVALCSAAAAGVSIAFAGASPLSALSVAAGPGASLATLLLTRIDRTRCELCNRRLHGQPLVFRCPRCGLQVCEESCWSFEHRRCTLCLEQRVPVLPVRESWWMQVSGPRYEQGRCLICLASASQADLRACPSCRRLGCKPCWDFNNGACSRCGEALPDLPATLSAAVTKTS
jgi:hypothetical protein